MTTHEHDFQRALSSPAAGDCPDSVAAHDAFFTLPDSSSLDAKKIRARCAAASYANFSDARPREPNPKSPRALAPASDTFQVGPQDMRNAQVERAEQKVNVACSRERARPIEACASRSLLFALSSPSCHPRCVRDGMESQSRACTRPHRGPRLSFRLLSREGERLSENRGAFHRGNRMTEGIAP